MLAQRNRYEPSKWSFRSTSFNIGTRTAATRFLREARYLSSSPSQILENVGSIANPPVAMEQWMNVELVMTREIRQINLSCQRYWRPPLEK